MMIVSFYSQVLPIVVLYKQRIDQSLTLSTLNQNLTDLGIKMDIFLYDNSPEKQYDQHLFQWENFNITYLHDTKNSGLSKAYNTGADHAKTLKKKWILLLDQDTDFPAGFLKENQQSIIQHPDISLFAPMLKLKNDVLFSPCIAKHKRGYPPGHLYPGVYSLWYFSPVNSGMLISLALFDEVGGYNEKVKIDFCDFQFLEKVRKVNDKFYLIDATALQDFSSFELSSAKQKTRFIQYLEDALNCEKPGLADKFGFFYTVSRHALGLSLKLRDPSFFGLYVRNYLMR